MKKLFLDTNILLDVLLERHPFCQPAQLLWSKTERKEIKAAISAISINNIFFIIRKLASQEKAYEAIEALLKTFTIVKVDSQLIKKALKARCPDFEDAVQLQCALQFGAEAIISRNSSDFKESRITVMNASEYLALAETLQN